MAKLSFLKRIITEDFASDDQELVGKLASVLNPALEAMVSAMSRNLTFEENIYSQVKDIEVEVDAKGDPKVVTSFKSTLTSSSRGLIVIRAQNLTNPTGYPTGAPFISFTESSGQVYIDNITGLKANNKYRLRIISIG